ncbi:hypothetical protein DPMN_137979 [Dreissena polymorpha]|uniref:Uncharacterized protein n=1 Tax=Dreissena polymorpha TaxID=45954 RepID=A0A9D4G2W8_DREPO|nr:hypothetical protein DPMN_137979 [Dreissena polymorpha]
MAPLFNAVDQLVRHLNSNTNKNVTKCITNIPENSFHYWLLPPSGLMIILLAFSFHQKSLFLSCLDGRPAAVLNQWP